MEKTELPLKLLDTLKYVSKKSLFYQRLFLRHSLDINKIVAYEDFLKIPLTNAVKNFRFSGHSLNP